MKKHYLNLYIIILIMFGAGYGYVQAADVDYTPIRVTDKIQIIYGPFDLPDSQNRGFRSNVVIVSTNEGVVILDPGGSAYVGEMVVKIVKTMTQSPIVAVFNSHAHGDHWLGNEGITRHYPEVAIYGHPTMKAKVEGTVGDYWLEMINKVTEGTADGRRVVAPNMVVNDGDEITIGDTVFHVYHTGPAHTDNDIMVEVVGENTLFMGDVVRNGLIGMMEDDSDFKNNIATIDFIVSKNFRYNIPAHGEIGGADMPLNYRLYLETLRNTVGELYQQGLEDFEMKEVAKNAVSAYKEWAGFDIRVGAHISRVYLEIEAEDFE